MFWINVGVGAVLALAAAAMAPLLVAFYGEPRLLSLTIASSAAFLFGGLGVQHRALLTRGMRFADLFHGHDERIPIDGLAWGTEVLAEVVTRTCA